MTTSDILGSGWQFPVDIDGTGQMALITGEAVIEQSIRTILRTVPGERWMRPEFGCYLHELVFAPQSPTTAGLVDYHVREALGRWEPRIEVEQVLIHPEEEQVGVLLIEIHYRIRSTNDRRNLVYPFYRIPEEM